MSLVRGISDSGIIEIMKKREMNYALLLYYLLELVIDWLVNVIVLVGVLVGPSISIWLAKFREVPYT